MISITAQPHDSYFAWQIEVQIVNFRKFDLEDKMHVLVWYPELTTDLSKWKNLSIKYPKVKFFFYRDNTVNLQLYIPQLRPNILAKHFDMFPELKNEVIFYHDSDIIFNYLPNFEKLIEGDINWQSDTSSYLDYDYLYRKEKQGNISEHIAIQRMCDIGKISIDTLKSYTGKTGGAQYILKDIDGDFWRDVERQCLDIRRNFLFGQPNSINTLYFPNESEGYQSWCADMWAVNMALWNRGKITDITEELDFSWGTSDEKAYQSKPIFHNAGVVNSSTNLFYKGAWIHQSPIGVKHTVKENTASWYYVKAIEAVNNL